MSLTPDINMHDEFCLPVQYVIKNTPDICVCCMLKKGTAPAIAEGILICQQCANHSDAEENNARILKQATCKGCENAHF